MTKDFKLKHFLKSIAAIFFAAVIFNSCTKNENENNAAGSLFSYKKSEIKIIINDEKESSDLVIKNIYYADSVSALIIEPKEKGNYPAIIYQHWGLGDKDEFLNEAIEMGKIGCVSLLPEARWLQPHNKNKSFSANAYEYYRDGVIDIRKGIDLLYSNPKVDSNKIIFVGHCEINRPVKKQ
ncbi:MAG: hypothetical protein ABI550_07095 [Ignavibacteriaceae bacterium]